jgi:hypothetical protein
MLRVAVATDNIFRLQFNPHQKFDIVLLVRADSAKF